MTVKMVAVETMILMVKEVLEVTGKTIMKIAAIVTMILMVLKDLKCWR